MALPEYTVQRKAVRGLRLRVTAPHGTVKVSAPHYASERAIEEFVRSKAEWIRKHQARMATLPAPLEAGPEAETLRAALKSKVGPLVAYWADRMGLEAPTWGIRRMTTRWGTCNIQRRHVTIALELARRDEELLEYVVVHELAHLFEPGHGPAFRAIMDRHLPDWRMSRARLNGRDA